MDFKNDINIDLSENDNKADENKNVISNELSLYEEWLELKKIEAEAYLKRTTIIEPKILKQLNAVETQIRKSTSKTHKDGMFAIEVKRNLSFKCTDLKQLEMVFKDVDDDLKPYKLAATVSGARLEALLEFDTKRYERAIEFIECNETKPTINIKPILIAR